MKRILLLQLFLFTAFGFAQVGVNTTTPHPSSMLDVTATNKGALFPRVSLSNINVTMLDGTNTAATGLLIWNTNAATIGGNGVGYYFFNGTIWVPVMQTASSDHDWYEVGTTTAPDAITDRMFHTGNVAIGKNTISAENPKLSIEESGPGTLFPLKIFNLRDISSSSNEHYGIYLEMEATSAANEYGITVQHNNPNAPLKYGIESIVQNGSGTNSAIEGRVSGTGYNSGSSILILDSGSPSSATQAGFQVGFEQPTMAFTMGLYNQFLSNNLAGDSGSKFGVYNAFGSATRNVGGELYGSYTLFDPNLTSTSNKYGSYTSIPSSLGGIHYGIYSEATKGNSYAGYFLGRMSIGTTPINNYILPSSRGTANQIMQTDGAGNVSWVNPSTIDTDNQQIDFLSLTGDVLNISLLDDGVATQTLNLAAIDNQATDVFSLTGTTLNLSLQNDGVATQTVDLSSLAGDDDWTDVGADIERQAGNVYIGDTSGTNNNLYISNQIIDWDNVTYTIDPNGDSVMNEILFDNGTVADPSIRFTEVNTGFFSPAADVFAYSANGTEAFRIHPSGNIAIGQTIDPDFRLSASSLFGNNNVRIGNENPADNVIEVDHGGQSGNGIEVNSSSGYNLASRSAISANNTINAINVDISRFEAGTFNLFGVKSVVTDNPSGVEYGVYSEALQANGFAGYFLGRMSIGTTTANNYILPGSRGTNGQIMQTNATGVVSWVNPTTIDTDNQATDIFSLTGTTLNLSLQDDGVATQTVDLSSLTRGADNGLSLVTGNIGLGGTLNRATTVDMNTFGANFNMNNSGDFNVQDAGATVFSVQDNGNAYFANKTSFGKTTNPLYLIDAEQTTAAETRGINLVKTDGTASETYGIFVAKTGNGTGGSHAMYNEVSGTGTGQKYGVFNELNSAALGNQYAVRNWIRSNTSDQLFGVFNNIANAGTGDQYGVYNGMRGTATSVSRGVYNEFNTAVNATELTGLRNQISEGTPGADGFNGVYNYFSNANNGNFYGNRTEYTAVASGTGNKYGSYNLISTAAGGTHYGTYNSVDVTNGWAGYFLGKNYISERLSIGEVDNINAALSINKSSTGTYAHIELKETTANDGARFTFSNTAEVTNNWLLYGRADNTITDSRFNIFHTTTGNIMQITGDGLVGILRAPTTNQLEINGTASKAAAGAFLANSDSRLKKNIATISPTEALEKVLSLRGVTYEWNDNKTGMNRPEGTQIGFVAQEIQQVFPEKVTEDKQGYLQTAYGDYDAIIFQAIKALNDKIEKLEKENEELKKLIRN